MTLALTGRYLVEYARRPLNLALLVLVPVIFVAVAAGALADFAELLGGAADAVALESAAAGWAAAFLAGVAGFFHVTGSHAPDRRLAAAGTGTSRVVAARLGSALVLALLAAVAALAALALRTGIDDVPRAVGGTVLFALTYLAIGSSTGALVRSEVNGSLLIIFVWLLDVFLGPAMTGGTDVTLVQGFPTHYVSLVMLDTPSGHSQPLGDVGFALLWTLGALTLAVLLLLRAVRPYDSASRRLRPGRARLAAGLRYGLREYRRNPALWFLLIAVPLIFVSLSFAVTPDDPAPVELTQDGATSTRMLSMIDVHGAIMVPITVGFLAGLAGLFVMLGSAEGDRRLALAGFRASEVLAARLGVIGTAALLTTAVTLGVTALDFAPQAWGSFAGATLLVAITYGLLGVLVGSLFGRLGGLYVMFLLPFLDVGLAQNIMFDVAPPDWAHFMPAYGAVQVLVDGAFTATFDQTGPLVIAVAWLAAIAGTAAVVFHRVAAPDRT